MTYSMPVRFVRRPCARLISAAAVLGILAGCGGAPPAENSGGESAEAGRRPNVLFVAVDDLRPELGCYGVPEIRTPHLDRLASQGIMFQRAFAQVAACSPSRASLMTGMRPDSTRVWTLGEEFRKTIPDVVTMPQHFHAFGYYTVSIGKIFHNHMPDVVSWDEADLRPPVFSTPEWVDREPESIYHDEQLKKELAEVRARRIAKNPNAYAGGWAYGKSHEIVDKPDDELYDGAQTTLAIETLKRLKDIDQPFYLAVGYYRPHLPFVAPRKYWELYDRDAIPPAPNPFLPSGAPVFAINSQYELRSCYDLEWVKHPAVERVPDETARLLKHGYWASVSFVDACIGRLMDALAELGLAENTIVVVWGDHGWKLGEHGSFCKQTNYNDDTRVPLIVRAPGVRAGQTVDRLVELVDLYPTLSELAGIDIPANMEGSSFKPLLEDPELPWKSAAFSLYHQRPKVTLDGSEYMGYSMVTERYHLVEWHTWDDTAKTAGEMVVARELYDNQVDPQENLNLADRPENAELVAELSAQLRAGWQAARNAIPGSASSG